MIEVENLSKTFSDGDDRHNVLRELSLQVGEGEFVALLGRSGSGKSTLLNILAGIETADSGSVKFSGHDLSQLDDDRRTRLRRNHIGIVFQFFNLLPVLTVLDNVLLPAELSGRTGPEVRAQGLQLLEELGLANREHELPDHLSGGEQQRVAIARALINEPRLLLADEPTGNLDSTTGAATLDLLARVNREHGLTVVMATHSRQAAAVSSRVVRLQDGQLATTP